MSLGEVVLRESMLSTSSRRYLVRCPFHFERTPSAVIELASKMRGESKRQWYCNTCGARGTWHAPDATRPGHILMERHPDAPR